MEKMQCVSSSKKRLDDLPRGNACSSSRCHVFMPRFTLRVWIMLAYWHINHFIVPLLFKRPPSLSHLDVSPLLLSFSLSLYVSEVTLNFEYVLWAKYKWFAHRINSSQHYDAKTECKPLTCGHSWQPIFRDQTNQTTSHFLCIGTLLTTK